VPGQSTLRHPPAVSGTAAAHAAGTGTRLLLQPLQCTQNGLPACMPARRLPVSSSASLHRRSPSRRSVARLETAAGRWRGGKAGRKPGRDHPGRWHALWCQHCAGSPSWATISCRRSAQVPHRNNRLPVRRLAFPTGGSHPSSSHPSKSHIPFHPQALRLSLHPPTKSSSQRGSCW
jgi:hypothetical protein